MKKFLQTGFFLLFSVISQHLFAALPQAIRFATEATYPPFEFIDDKGEIQGFDIAIANALCQQMKVTCTFTNQPWDSLILSLKFGKFDALIGGINITDERKEQVDFTDPYYIDSASFVAAARKNIDVSPKHLKDKKVDIKIGVQGGTTMQHFLQDLYPKVKIKTYNSQQDAFLDLVANRVDVVLADTTMAKSWLKNNQMPQKYVIVGPPITDKKYFDMGYAITVRRGNTELVTAFNKALAQIKANGDYEKIINHYFPSE